MKLPSRTPETTKIILLSGTIESAQVSQHKAEMAACKPPMESGFAFLNSKAVDFLYCCSSTTQAFQSSVGEKLLELCSISLTLIPINVTTPVKFNGNMPISLGSLAVLFRNM